MYLKGTLKLQVDQNKTTLLIPQTYTKLNRIGINLGVVVFTISSYPIVWSDFYE